nr:transposase, MuDR, MULE transposase domain protein [Tanacetum cinerariifolium]
MAYRDYVNVDGGIITGCFGDVKIFLKNGKLEKVVAVINSCTPNALGDLTVTLKHLSGRISTKFVRVCMKVWEYGRGLDVVSCRGNCWRR